jgi:GTP-binding protein Era
MFAKDQVTDRSVRFLAAEIVREKLMRRLGYEVPHRLTVRVDEFKAGADVVHISTAIWVESEGQKGIVIGNRGTVLRDIGTQARREIEHMLGRRVFLETWVKVKKNWSDDALALQQLGYQDPERRALEL